MTDPPVTDPPVDDGVVSSLDEVRGAVVQIEAADTFVDPEFGTYEGAGSGSGFVIGDGNLAVTNNHVVTGAGLLRVYVDGDTEPRNARVLGVSECSDLAVIAIDGEQLPTLPWSEAEGQPGAEIYVAGFPLGDPEYTLTRGVISKARASGDTNWASIDHTIEHDAAAQPGNSGGPVVTPDGQVAGVHYASFVATNQSQCEYEVFNQCGGTDTVFVLVAAASNDGANGVVVAVQALTDADFAALDVILDSFDVIT